MKFDKVIKRRQIWNFLSDAVKETLAGKDKKMQELQGTRDLFGRLLYLAVIGFGSGIQISPDTDTFMPGPCWWVDE